MNTNEIRVEIKDWLFNAGIVGLYRILRHAEKDVKKKNNFIRFDSSALENFEHHFFEYFFDVYEKDSLWFKLTEFCKENSISNEQYEGDTAGIEEFIKRFDKEVDKSSYRTAYEIITKDAGCMKSKLKIIKDKTTPVPEKWEKIREIYTFFNRHKDIIQAKYLIYTIINNYWEGVCFLNPKLVNENMFELYKKDFIGPVFNFLKSESKSPKHKCINCNADINSQEYAYKLSWLKMDIDPPRKTSKYWNHKSDVLSCPICRLVYSCVPAGFVTYKQKGIFINDNSSIDELIGINTVVEDRLTGGVENMESLEDITYTNIINMIRQMREKNLRREVENIQVVKYDRDKGYTFNLLSKQVIEVIEKSKNELNQLAKLKVVFLDNKNRINLYAEVIDRIYRNINLYPMVYLLLNLSLKQKRKSRLSSLVFKINMNFLGGQMSEKKIYAMKQLGLQLKKGYKKKDEENKIQGIAYRLLNNLKTKKTNGFLDVVINCHMHIGKEVPTLFVECINDVERFQAYGYAFLLGFTGEEYRPDSEAAKQKNN